jgi:ComF family protein
MVPVPLHKKKERLRGFNQSDCFARGMARATGIPYSERLLVRTVMNDTQTDKSRMDRWKNVEGIFSVADESMIIGKRILLVDDVITTGATMEACAIPMFICGAREISTAAIAIAQ